MFTDVLILNTDAVFLKYKRMGSRSFSTTRLNLSVFFHSCVFFNFLKMNYSITVFIFL